MKTPIMIHRAILGKPCFSAFLCPAVSRGILIGSLERMMAILIEHTGGKWPFWLSPRQIVVCSISDAHAEYAATVAARLHDAGYFVELDTSSETLNKYYKNSVLHFWGEDVSLENSAATNVELLLAQKNPQSTAGSDQLHSRRGKPGQQLKEIIAPVSLHPLIMCLMIPGTRKWHGICAIPG